MTENEHLTQLRLSTLRGIEQLRVALLEVVKLMTGALLSAAEPESADAVK